MFYYRPEDFDCRPMLYGFTDSKKLAKEFESQRNPKVIIKVKKENYSKTEWQLLNTNYSKLKIIDGHFYTRSEFFGKRKPVRVVCTCKEEESIFLEADKMWAEYSKYLFDTRAFKDEYIVALEKLLFMQFYCFYIIKRVQDADYFYEPYYSSFGSNEPFYDDFNSSRYEYDDLRVFLKFYQHTFADIKG